MHHDRDPVRREHSLVLRVLVANEDLNAFTVGDLQILRRHLERLSVRERMVGSPSAASIAGRGSSGNGGALATLLLRYPNLF